MGHWAAFAGAYREAPRIWVQPPSCAQMQGRRSRQYFEIPEFIFSAIGLVGHTHLRNSRSASMYYIIDRITSMISTDRSLSYLICFWSLSRDISHECKILVFYCEARLVSAIIIASWNGSPPRQDGHSPADIHSPCGRINRPAKRAWTDRTPDRSRPFRKSSHRPFRHVMPACHARTGTSVRRHAIRF